MRCATLAAYEKLPAGPKVVLATMASLEFGFARDLFVAWASIQRNVVVRPSKAEINVLTQIRL